MRALVGALEYPELHRLGWCIAADRTGPKQGARRHDADSGRQFIQSAAAQALAEITVGHLAGEGEGEAGVVADEYVLVAAAVKAGDASDDGAIL